MLNVTGYRRIVLLSLLWLQCMKTNANVINVVTEDEFPIQYLENHQLVGPASNVVRLLLEKAGYEYSPRVLPWSRAYKEAKTIPNTIIFSMVRTHQRENQFHWLGEIKNIRYVLIRLKKRHDLQLSELSPEGLGTNRIGVIRDSALHIYFKNLGLDYNLIVSGDEGTSYGVLLKERVEFIPRNVLIMPLDCFQQSIDCNQFEVAHELVDFKMGVYIAMNKNSDAFLVANLKQQFSILEADGEIHKLMKDAYSIEHYQQRK